MIFLRFRILGVSREVVTLKSPPRAAETKQEEEKKKNREERKAARMAAFGKGIN